MLKKALKRFLGRRAHQSAWEKLNLLSLYGMNIGRGADISDSGELWVIDNIAKHVQNNRTATVFDVGANIGTYASTVMERLAGRVRLFCFEPSHDAYKLLVDNLSKYRSLEVFNFGFGNNEESVTLYSNEPASSLASVYHRRLDHFGIDMKPVGRVRLRKLDVFCEERVIEHIDLLKLDVEGHELDILRGGEGLIKSQSIDFIQFEFGGTDIDSRRFFRDFFYLLNPGYRIFRILRDGLAPIATYHEKYEIFACTNYLAVSRRVKTKY